MGDHLFISYSHVDQEFVADFCRRLEATGIPYFRDEKDITWGKSILQSVRKGLEECIAVIVVISPATLKSEWVPFEVGHAIGNNKMVFPLLTHPSLDVPGYLQDVLWLTNVDKAIEYFQSPAWQSLLETHQRQRSVESMKLLPPDIRQRIADTVEEASTLFATLGSHLSGYYAAALVLRLNLLDHTTANPDIQSYLSNPLPEGLRDDAEAVLEAMAEVGGALVELHKNRFAVACWKQAAETHGADALQEVGRQMMEHGFSESESHIAATDTLGLSQFFKIATSRHRDQQFGSYLSAVLATNSADIEKVGKGYDHAALRSLMFSGNLIFSFVRNSKADPEQLLVVAWGAAMLLDMYKCLPDSDCVRSVLLKQYAAYSEVVAMLPLSMDPSEMISNELMFPLQELDHNRQLLFLEIK